MKRKKKVYETKSRSLLKVVSGRILEILVDTLLLNVFIQRVELSLFLSVVVEGLCTLTHYINERLWNLSDFGRNVLSSNGVCPECKRKRKEH